MYAICFDMTISELEKSYGVPYNKAYDEIRKAISEFGFEWKQGSTYFGTGTNINAVSCVIAVQELTKRFSWFGKSIRDIRMLKIEENNDLMPAVLSILKK